MKTLWLILLGLSISLPLAAEDVRIFYSGGKVSRGKTIAKVGDRVTLYNQSKTPHFFRSTKPGFEFVTPVLKFQESYTVVFFNSGATTIECPEHPALQITLIIQQKSTGL